MDYKIVFRNIDSSTDYPVEVPATPTISLLEMIEKAILDTIPINNRPKELCIISIERMMQ